MAVGFDAPALLEATWGLLGSIAERAVRRVPVGRASRHEVECAFRQAGSQISVDHDEAVFHPVVPDAPAREASAQGLGFDARHLKIGEAPGHEHAHGTDAAAQVEGAFGTEAAIAAGVDGVPGRE
ncbi:hypothetical protein D3C72_1604320 [compost metagenome]